MPSRAGTRAAAAFAKRSPAPRRARQLPESRRYNIRYITNNEGWVRPTVQHNNFPVTLIETSRFIIAAVHASQIDPISISNDYNSPEFTVFPPPPRRVRHLRYTLRIYIQGA